MPNLPRSLSSEWVVAFIYRYDNMTTSFFFSVWIIICLFVLSLFVFQKILVALQIGRVWGTLH